MKKGKEVKLVMDLHIYAIIIQARHLSRNKILSGPSTNDPENLEKSMLIFSLTTLTGEKRSINLCTKPVHNLKGDYLHKILIKNLVKVKEYGFDVAPVIFDEAVTNVKLAKKLLKLKNESKNNTSISAAMLKLETSFEHEGKIYLVVCFHYSHAQNFEEYFAQKNKMIICIRN